MGARPRAENFEDQAGPVDDLGLPAPFEIALLHRAQRGVDDDEPDLVFADQSAEVFDCAAAEQGARARARDAGDLGAHDIEADRPGEPDRLVEPRFDRAAGYFIRSVVRAPFSAPDARRARGRSSLRRDRRWVSVLAQDSAISLPPRTAGSAAPASPSRSRAYTPAANARPAAAARKNCRTKYNPLQLDAVDEKNGYRCLVLADVVQEYVLNVLRFFGSHGSSPLPSWNRAGQFTPKTLGRNRRVAANEDGRAPPNHKPCTK